MRACGPPSPPPHTNTQLTHQTRLTQAALELVHEELRSSGQHQALGMHVSKLGAGEPAGDAISSSEAHTKDGTFQEKDAGAAMQDSEGANVAAFQRLWKRLESQGRVPAPGQV